MILAENRDKKGTNSSTKLFPSLCGKIEGSKLGSIENSYLYGYGIVASL